RTKPGRARRRGTARPEGAVSECGRSRAVRGGAGRPGPREPCQSADEAGPCAEARDGPARGSRVRVRTKPGRARMRGTGRPEGAVSECGRSRAVRGCAGRPGPREPCHSADEAGPCADARDGPARGSRVIVRTKPGRAWMRGTGRPEGAVS